MSGHQDKPIHVIAGFTRGHNRVDFFKHLQPYAYHLYGVCVATELHAQRRRKFANLHLKLALQPPHVTFCGMRLTL